MVDRYHTLEYHQEKLVLMMDEKQKKGGRGSALSSKGLLKGKRPKPTATEGGGGSAGARDSTPPPPPATTSRRFSLSGLVGGSAVDTIATSNLQSPVGVSPNSRSKGNADGDDDDMILVD